MAISLVLLVCALPAAFFWLRWYVRRYAEGRRFRWWQKPFILWLSLAMLALPFRVANIAPGQAPTGNPEQEPIFAIGACLVVLGFVLWFASSGFRAVLVSLLAERPIDFEPHPPRDIEPTSSAAMSHSWLAASDRVRAPDREERL